MDKSTGKRRRKSSSRSVRPRDVHLSASRRAAKKRAPLSTKPKRSKPEQELLELLRSRGYKEFVTEYMPVTSRRWRVDFAWPAQKVAVEIEGGIFMRGRHVRPSGFINDCEKYNALTLNGWRVYRVPVVKGWQDAAILYIQTEKLG